ncbi:ABC transporter ATP-binding protein [Paracoccaceae bacterium GXU_MW_L88]
MAADMQQGAGTSAPLALELKGISKSFGPVKANQDIDLQVRKGTIHGIVGENGAGKSTLMSIIYGFYSADKGDIRINGQKVEIKNSDDAIAHGIGMVHQHFMLVQPFTVLENIILGAEDGRMLRPSLAKARDRLKELAEEYELRVDPDATVGDLSVGMQQRVEILKALYREADILILDEPTGVLTPTEADHLFRILEGLKNEGKTIILITHKLREIMAATDTVSVMRRGEMTATVETASTSPAELAELMVGREVLLRVDKAPAQPGEVVLSVDKLRCVNSAGVEKLRGISFDLRKGEILGVAGVAGNGQSELLEILAGIREAAGGTINFEGQTLDLTNIYNADDRRKVGINHVPEDRHRRGMIMPFSAWENASFGYHDHPDYQTGPGLLDIGKMKRVAEQRMENFDVRPRDINLKSANFSGGNQQKLVIAREIEQNPDLLLVGQPTRGVDIGAIEFIHKEIIKLRDEGKAILLVSVELEEILGLSDRIMVMFDGRISGIVDAATTDEGELGLLMAGIDDDQPNEAHA